MTGVQTCALPILANVSSINANIGSYYTYANATYSTQANAGGLYNNIQTLNANVGAYEIWANANVSGLQNQITAANIAWQANAAFQGTWLSNLQANVTTLTANTAGLYTSIQGANAAISSLQANIGSYYTYANATYSTQSNAAGLSNSITGANATVQNLSANIGSYYTWANLKDRKSTRLNSSHIPLSRMPSSA